MSITEEWIKKMWYIYTMEYYSAIKRNKIVPFAETWVDLEIVILSELSQKEKNKYHILTHICGIQQNGTKNLFAKLKQRHRRREQMYGHQGGWWGGMDWEIGIDICTLLRMKQMTGECLVLPCIALYCIAQGEKNKKIRSVCKTYMKLTLKMHSNIYQVQTNTV